MRSLSLAEEILGGEEPKFDNSSLFDSSPSSYKMNLINALNYYAKNSNLDKSKEWTLKYLKKEKGNVDDLLAVKSYHFNNLGFLLRIKERGFIFNENDLKKIQEKIEQLYQKIEKPKKKQKEKNKSAIAKEEPILDQFDLCIDKRIEDKDSCFPEIKTTKEKNILEKEIEKWETDIKESKDCYRKETLEKIVSFLNELKEKISKTPTTKTNPTRRKRNSVKKQSVNLSKFRYKREDEILGKTISPEKLIGSKQALIYNTKEQIIQYFKSEDEKGFEISGTTLKNFKKEESFFKKISKEKVLPILKNATIEGIKKRLQTEVKTKAHPCGGRFNEEMIILRVK